MKKNFLNFVLLALLHFVALAQPSFRTQIQADDFPGSLQISRDSMIAWRPFKVPTIGIQILTGVGGWMVGGIASLPFQAAGGDLTAAILIAGIGYTGGFYLGGKWMGGNGEFIPTVVYPAVGAVGLLGIVAIAAGNGGGGELSGLGGAFVLGAAGVGLLVGSFLGYHLSASPIYRQVEVSFSPSDIASDASTAMSRIIDQNYYRLTLKFRF